MTKTGTAGAAGSLEPTVMGASEKGSQRKNKWRLEFNGVRLAAMGPGRGTGDGDNGFEGDGEGAGAGAEYGNGNGASHFGSSHGNGYGYGTNGVANGDGTSFCPGEVLPTESE